jgi:SAM-dependent methyltransferase
VRLEHLANLNLDLGNKTVLEVGAGVGHLTSFWIDRGCIVTSTEGREENVFEFHKRHPDWEVWQIDLEKPHSHAQFGTFDIVFCYGALYHVANPLLTLESLAEVCGGLFLLETCVWFEDDGGTHPVREGGMDQSIHGTGCRPSRNWIFSNMRTIFNHTYMPTTQPYHHEYPIFWPSTPHGFRRSTFIGSSAPLDNPMLSEQLLTEQSWV